MRQMSLKKVFLDFIPGPPGSVGPCAKWKLHRITTKLIIVLKIHHLTSGMLILSPLCSNAHHKFCNNYDFLDFKRLPNRFQRVETSLLRSNKDSREVWPSLS